MTSFQFIPNAQAWGIILGVLTPLLISVIQQPGWSQRSRQWVALGVSLVVGLGTAFAAGGLDSATDLLTTVAAVVVAAEAFYQKVWRPLGVTPVIEVSTSPATGGGPYGGGGQRGV